MQRTTWILVAIALALGGFVYVYESQGKPREATEAQRQIFEFEEEEIQELTIIQPEQTLKFERTDNDLQPWQMQQPEAVPANDAVVSFLLNLLVEGKSDRTFTIAPEQKSEYGLETPLAEIEVKLKNHEHKLILGKPSFDNQFLYAQVDPANQNHEDLSIVLVPIDFQYAVERDLKEWQQLPPVAN